MHSHFHQQLTKFLPLNVYENRVIAFLRPNRAKLLLFFCLVVLEKVWEMQNPSEQGMFDGSCKLPLCDLVIPPLDPTSCNLLFLPVLLPVIFLGIPLPHVFPSWTYNPYSQEPLCCGYLYVCFYLLLSFACCALEGAKKLLITRQWLLTLGALISGSLLLLIFHGNLGEFIEYTPLFFVLAVYVFPSVYFGGRFLCYLSECVRKRA